MIQRHVIAQEMFLSYFQCMYKVMIVYVAMWGLSFSYGDAHVTAI